MSEGCPRDVKGHQVAESDRQRHIAAGQGLDGLGGERLSADRPVAALDLLDDGSLDQTDELLGQLDVVVASVHSKLRMPSGPMTERMIAAIGNPHTDVLGHCTGRLLTGRGRPQSEFDAEAVFSACRDRGVAVEINCRPERQDPPDDLLRLAVEIGCVFAINTDAHAPGQLDWLEVGCRRAEQFGIGPDRVINTRDASAMTALAR